MGKRKDTKAADLARSIWRLQGECEFCGKTKDEVQLQGAHIFGAGAYPRIKADLRNGLSLCSWDHRRFTSDPLSFTDWIRTTKYKKYEKPLKETNLLRHKIFWDDEIEKLKDIKRAIETNELTLDEAREYYA